MNTRRRVLGSLALGVGGLALGWFVVAVWVAPTRSNRAGAARTDTAAPHDSELEAPEPLGAAEHERRSGSGTLALRLPDSSDEFFPRPEEEWQGMLVRRAWRAPCDVSSDCGLALACRAGVCGPCESDSDCAEGEGCVLDHCMRQRSIGCRARRDCAAGELCILSGLSGGLRGNAEMRSYCLSEDTGLDAAAPTPDRTAQHRSEGAAGAGAAAPSTAERTMERVSGAASEDSRP